MENLLCVHLAQHRLESIMHIFVVMIVIVAMIVIAVISAMYATSKQL